MKISIIILIFLPAYVVGQRAMELDFEHNINDKSNGSENGNSKNEDHCYGQGKGLLIPATSWRSFDGSDHPNGYGEAETPLIRMASEMSYPDGNGEEMKAGPNARNVSNVVCTQESLNGNSAGLSDIVWQFGQFLDHDISLTDSSSFFGSGDIPITDENDLFYFNGCSSIRFDRSVCVGGGGEPRQQINLITSFIDGSNIYGSHESTANYLRTLTDGLMRTSQNGMMLPLGPDGYEAGDIRVNEQIGLTSMHTLFVREHNRLAAEIKDRFCGATDEEIFQLARKLVGATLQIITYKEFLVALVGSAAPGMDSSFNENVDPSVANEFSTVAYRVGHTMLSPQLQFRDENGNTVMDDMLLRDAFVNPGFFDSAAINVDYILGGQMAQECQEIDGQIIDEARDFLFDDGCLDLASLNIQRGRDHGIMDYNGLRVAMGLNPASDFSDITSNVEMQDKLRAVYETVDNVDAWIGGLVEDHAHGVVGELFETIIVDQYVRLRDGDKFWFMNDPDVLDPRLNGFWRMEEVSLDKVFRDNTIHKSANNVFYV